MQKNKRWQISSILTYEADELLAAFPPTLRQLLFNRGYSTDADARCYLRAQTSFDSDPFQMSGMREAVGRIRLALKNNESIAVYGDYDVDGVTATALLVETLLFLGANAVPYIPNRFEEGYGLNPNALDELKASGVRLVITVDCGIRSPNEANYARSIGLDIIITDHHQPADEALPSALAVIDPKQEGDLYPDKDLAGVGVAYKIAQALCEESGINDSKGLIDPGASKSTFLESLLDLVALGTVADLAPLVGENRSLVRKGLKKIRETTRQGLFSLAAVAGLSLPLTTAINIGFILGPRLNAAGRLDSAKASFELLTTKDVKRAGELAQLLNTQNQNRQVITRKIQEQAETIALAEGGLLPNILFAVHEEFNSGVVGLAAARLVETYYRPAVVGQIMEETTRCSCRSIPEFHITQALDECKDLLIRHGGHAGAAGFTVENRNLEELKHRLKACADSKLDGLDLMQTISADMEIPLAYLNFELLKHLEYFQPTGYGNPDALFVTRNVRIKSSRVVGAEGKHLKLVVTDGYAYFDAIGFRLGHLLSSLPKDVDLIYTFESNEYLGRKSMQLNLKDIRPASQED
jgi:single-stranded-DNA-specific exonuclease